MKSKANQGVLSLALLVSSILLLACASSSPAGVAPIYTFAGGIALKGYGAVAYFNEGKAALGSDRFAHEWNGATWRFANAANRDAFARDSRKYAPQYGGYCSWAVSHGYTAKGDPEAWKIVDGSCT